MSKHTPGPWRFGGAYVHDAQGLRIAEVYAPRDDDDDAPGWEERWDEAERTGDVNGILMTAAPQLRDACHAALEWRGLDGDGISDPVRQQLVAAIAAATDVTGGAKTVCDKKASVAAGPAAENGAAYMWALGDDTGVASLTIWHVMAGWPSVPRRCVASTPRDAGDFGRCHRLLTSFPAWRQRLPEVVARYPDWASLVRHWQELTDIYLRQAEEGGDLRAFDARLREIKTGGSE